MKRKIFQSMCLLAIFAIVLTALVLGAFFSGELYQSMKQQLRSEAVYLAEAIDSGGLRYLQQVSAANADTRITLIAADGTVLFDNSLQDEQLAENHNERPEVIAARKFGSGEAVRDSATVGQQTFYYALRLEAGQVLRVSHTMHSLWRNLLEYAALCSLFCRVDFIAGYAAGAQTGAAHCCAYQYAGFRASCAK